jgi:hypothetical protein
VLWLSGDITQRARASQFKSARAFCDRLAIARLMALPGNHDIPLFNLYQRLFTPYARYLQAFGPALETCLDTPQLRVVALRTPTLFVGNNDLQLARVGIDEKQVNSVNAGELAGIVVKPIGTLALFGLLLRGLAGRLGDADSVDSFSFRRLTITPKGRKRIKVATDGEVVWMQAPLVFEVAAQTLLLMVPAPTDRVEVA